jgi:hypothetical protein
MMIEADSLEVLGMLCGGSYGMVQVTVRRRDIKQVRREWTLASVG